MAVTVEMELRGVRVASVSFYRSLIRSDARLTYDQVDRVFDGSEQAGELWAEPLAAAERTHAAVLQAAMRRVTAKEWGEKFTGKFPKPAAGLFIGLASRS